MATRMRSWPPANAAGLIDHALAAASPDRRPGTPTAETTAQVPGGHAYTRPCYQDPAGTALAERWTVHHGGHAWSGGVPDGFYTDPRGPDAQRRIHPLLRRAPRRPAVPLTGTGRPASKGEHDAGQGDAGATRPMSTPPRGNRPR